MTNVSTLTDRCLPVCAQSVVLAGKALALAAAASAVGGRNQALTPAVSQLLRCLAITATGNPVAALRDAAFLALDAVLSALQVGRHSLNQGREGSTCGDIIVNSIASCCRCMC